MNHVDKYYWIIDHPAFTKCCGQAVIELTPHMVNPENETIESDHSLNTAFRWWVELSYEIETREFPDGIYHHDWNLDCGGCSAEEAIENLYELVLEHYGEYE